jgi:hypothetical protein
MPISETNATEEELCRLRAQEARLRHELVDANRTLTLERASNRPEPPLWSAYGWLIVTAFFFFVAAMLFRCVPRL